MSRDKIEHRLWLAQAQALLPGADDKIIHQGCGDRPSLFIKNDSDRYWCYCHRCRRDGVKSKEVPRIKQKLATKTGWKPETMHPMVQAVVEQPYNFRELFQRFELAPYVSLLKFSPETKRVYFPDESASLLGLDATFLANARFYSPVQRNLAVTVQGGARNLYVTGSLAAYLEAVHTGAGAILTMNKAADKATASLVATYADKFESVILLKLHDNLRRELMPFI